MRRPLIASGPSEANLNCRDDPSKVGPFEKLPGFFRRYPGPIAFSLLRPPFELMLNVKLVDLDQSLLPVPRDVCVLAERLRPYSPADTRFLDRLARGHFLVAEASGRPAFGDDPAVLPAVGDK
jgi:hypothetical protein